MEREYLPKSNRRFANSLQTCLNELKKSWKDLDKLSKLNENWEKVIGLELSKQCKPLKIEKKILTVAVNHPQWRQALTYNKHKLKETIDKLGIYLDEIKIIQNYEAITINKKDINPKSVWDNHPNRIINQNTIACKFCNSPTPEGEILRWGKCTFCWRKNN